ncbi:MarR family transcriptional regulator [Geodermatophilus sp. YIM 151500]|uniref:MarR family transcriptional regulator n=1 Tax=Geodermatophilus sp. YIM 151500 TaxID=2984531 RepID=UPI0021E42865|nr:MarR family transcriptional regulator [Geodermatophilus sp. YIM 151500]MCV2487779.1 MarR family transcriptional regulator [Geodermatophilus sp. YIM 151500]
MTPDTSGDTGSVAGRSVPPDVAEVLRLAEEVGAYGVRRRLGTLLHTPLTVQQLRCLTILVVQGTATPHVLSEALEVTPATLTGIADRLVRAGMVTRRPDERDGRGRRLAPTPAAQEVVRQLMASDIEADAAVLSALTAEELAGIRLGLSGVLRVLRASADDGPAAR